MTRSLTQKEIMDYYVTVWYSVGIISTVTHLAQAVSSQGFTSIVKEKCIKTCCLSIITTVITLIQHQLHACWALTPVDLATVAQSSSMPFHF